MKVHNYMFITPERPALTVHSVSEDILRAESPEGRLVCHYGHTNVYKIIFQVQNIAREQNGELYTIEMSIDTPFQSTPTSMDNLMERTHVNLSALTQDAAAYLYRRLKLRPSKKFSDLNEMVAENPSLVNAIWAMEEFVHIEVLVWRKDGDEHVPTVQFAALRDPGVIDSYTALNYPDPYPKIEFDTTPLELWLDEEEVDCPQE